MTQKLVSLVLALALLCLCFPALGEGVAVTDMAGREIKLAGPAGSIVVLMPSDCEILYAIGAGDKVVGRGTYCNYPEDVLSVTEVNSGGELNLEQIIGLKPDLVVMTKMAHNPEAVSKLEEAGIAVIVTDAQTIEDTYACITLLGAAAGKPDEAAKVVEDMKTRLAAVAQQAGETGLTVYIETTPMEYGWGLYSAGPGNFMDEIASLCGLKNIFGDVDQAWPVVDPEAVIAADPDLILTIDSNGMGEGMEADKVILSREAWQDMKAVKEGRVYVVSNDMFSRPAPRLADAAEYLLNLVQSLTAAEEPAA